MTNEEPTTLGAASADCGGSIQNIVCDDIASDPLTWIDNTTAAKREGGGFEVEAQRGV